jgi:hypothetical protein
MLRDRYKSAMVASLLLAASPSFGFVGTRAPLHQPAQRCYTWSYEPTSCVNNYCYYDAATGYCQEDHGPSPDCHLYDGAADFCRDVRHCVFDPGSRVCSRDDSRGE